MKWKTQLGGSAGYQPSEYDARPDFDARRALATKRRVKLVVQGVIRVGLTCLGAATSLRLLPRSPLRAGDPRIHRILIIRTDLIGDLVLSLPALSALSRAYPTAEIDFLVLPSTARLLEGDPRISRIFTYDPNIWRTPVALVLPRNWRQARQIVRTLRSRNYDLCLSIAGDWASVLAWFSGATRRVGFAGEAYPGLMTDPVPGGRYRERKHEVRYVQQLVKAAGGILGDDEVPRLHVSASAVTSLAERLQAVGVPAQRPLITLHPGARNGKAKRWPLEHWRELAHLLAQRLDATVVIVGAPGERETARAIVGAVAGPIYDLTGKTSLPELAALLARSDLVISGDSGPMHIACAVDTPVIGLFGPTDPRISGPLGPDAIVMRHDIWCGPCYDASATADCRFHNPVCMKTISAGAVFVAAKRQLEHLQSPTISAQQACSEEPTVATTGPRRLRSK